MEQQNNTTTNKTTTKMKQSKIPQMKNLSNAENVFVFCLSAYL